MSKPIDEIDLKSVIDLILKKRTYFFAITGIILLIGFLFAFSDKGVWLTSYEVSKVPTLEVNSKTADLGRALFLVKEQYVENKDILKELYSNYRAYLLSADALADFDKNLEKYANSNFQDLQKRETWIAEISAAKIAIKNIKSDNLLITSTHPSQPAVASENLKLFLSFSLKSFYSKHMESSLLRLEELIKEEESIGITDLQRQVYLLDRALQWVRAQKSVIPKKSEYVMNNDSENEVFYSTKSEYALSRELSFLKDLGSIKTKRHFQLVQKTEKIKELLKGDSSEYAFIELKEPSAPVIKNNRFRTVLISLIIGLIVSFFTALVSEYGVRVIFNLL